MKNIQGIQLIMESNEELLPDFFMDFPYICSCVEFDKDIDPVVPWHWHHAVELFYIKSGRVEYTTPNGKWIFPAGTGGFVNSNVLHSSRVSSTKDGSGLEMICLSPEDPGQAALLQKIQAGFELEEGSWGYEITLRQLLTEVWLGLLELACAETEDIHKNKDTAEKMKAMMSYIQDHYTEMIAVDCLAREAHISKRVCFRLFQENLHMSPLEYMREYRLRKACMELIETEKSITEIASDCGFGSSSYFGKLFREHFNCSPVRYRGKWHDCNRNRHE